MTQLIATAVKFKIPDYLGQGAQTDVGLSELTGLDLALLRRFLRALQGLGLIEPSGPHEYRGTALAALLRRDTGNLYGEALMSGADYYDAWAELDYSLRTGLSAFQRRHGASLWARLCDDDEVAASFSRTMRWNTERVMHDVLDRYDFPATGLMVDVGAGDGTLLAGVLARYPRLRAIALEQGSVISHTRQTLGDHDLAGRCEFVPGDFLAQVPPGGDLYVLKAVIHNWNDAAALQILRNCRAALAEHGRLLVIERPMAADDALDAAVRDLSMLVLFGSQDRTVDEYRLLLDNAGFAVSRVLVGRSGVCLFEAYVTPWRNSDG